MWVFLFCVMQGLVSPCGRTHTQMQVRMSLISESIQTSAALPAHSTKLGVLCGEGSEELVGVLICIF